MRATTDGRHRGVLGVEGSDEAHFSSFHLNRDEREASNLSSDSSFFRRIEQVFIGQGNPPSRSVLGHPSTALTDVQPGSFLMGSPEAEQGRDGDELCHRVNLTRG